MNPSNTCAWSSTHSLKCQAQRKFIHIEPEKGECETWCDIWQVFYRHASSYSSVTSVRAENFVFRLAISFCTLDRRFIIIGYHWVTKILPNRPRHCTLYLIGAEENWFDARTWKTTHDEIHLIFLSCVEIDACKSKGESLSTAIAWNGKHMINMLTKKLVLLKVEGIIARLSDD